MHDPTKQLMGVTGSSCKDTKCYDVDPATFAAGLVCRLASTGLPALAKSAGTDLGVSLGESLSSTKKTTVALSGLDVPVLLTDDSDDYAYVVKGQPVFIDDATGMAREETVGETSVVNATYSSDVLDAVDEKGAIIGKCAKINFIGGL